MHYITGRSGKEPGNKKSFREREKKNQGIKRATEKERKRTRVPKSAKLGFSAQIYSERKEEWSKYAL